MPCSYCLPLLWSAAFEVCASVDKSRPRPPERLRPTQRLLCLWVAGSLQLKMMSSHWSHPRLETFLCLMERSVDINNSLLLYYNKDGSRGAGPRRSGPPPPLLPIFKNFGNISSQRAYNWPICVIKCQKFSRDLPFIFSWAAPDNSIPKVLHADVAGHPDPE